MRVRGGSTGQVDHVFYAMAFFLLFLGSLCWILFFFNRNHAWVSFEGLTEAYNDALDLPSNDCMYIHLKFICFHLHIMYDAKLIFDLILFFVGLDRRATSKCFFWGEVEQELLEIRQIGYLFQGSDFEDCLDTIDKVRCQELYIHKAEDCSDSCKARGTVHSTCCLFF